MRKLIGTNIDGDTFYLDYDQDGPLGKGALVNEDGDVYDVTTHVNFAMCAAATLATWPTDIGKDDLSDSLTEVQKIINNRFLNMDFLSESDFDEIMLGVGYGTEDQE